MAETMQFDLVSPERKLASLQAVMVQIPGAQGDLTAMPNHAATLTTLRPGLLRVVADKGDVTEYVVSGGFADISPEGTSVLAERAVAKDEAKGEFLDNLIRESEEALAHASDDLDKATIGQRINDYKTLQQQL